jgi:hypothetical protein
VGQDVVDLADGTVDLGAVCLDRALAEVGTERLSELRPAAHEHGAQAAQMCLATGYRSVEPAAARSRATVCAGSGTRAIAVPSDGRWCHGRPSLPTISARDGAEPAVLGATGPPGRTAQDGSSAAVPALTAYRTSA